MIDSLRTRVRKHQSLHFTLSLRMNSSFITSRPDYQICHTLKKNLDPGQVASYKPSDEDLRCFPLFYIENTWLQQGAAG